MDVESRLVHCMMTLQGFKADDLKNWYSTPGNDSDIEALVTFIGAKSNGMKINVPATHPAEAKMAKIGEYIFYRRAGPPRLFLLDLPWPGWQADPLAGTGQPDDQGRGGDGNEKLAVLSCVARDRLDDAASSDRLHASGALA